MSLRTFDDPALTLRCDTVMSGDDLSFLEEMRRVCDRENGVGLAAPQIGVLKRAVFIWPNRKGGEALFMLNPEIISTGHATAVESEGCLSYPGVWTPVERHLIVTVRYVNEDFRIRCRSFVYHAARVVQHEIDHLNGICRVGEAWRNQPKGKPASAAMAVLAMVATKATRE